MGINIYPTPTQNVTIDSNGNTVKVANNSGLINNGNPLSVTTNGVVQNVSVVNNSIIAKSIKSALNINTTQTLVTLANPSNHLIIHSITISQHITSGNAGDRLGLNVGYATTSGGYTQSDTNPTTSTTIHSNYWEKGSETLNFGETGIKLPAGNNVYFFVDDYNTTNVNFVISITYREVTP
jgi:hypothetical protein